MNAKHLLFGVALAALCQPAHADIMFSTGNTGGIGEVNIIFGTPQTGTTVTGQVDHSGVNASFSSLTGQTLMGQGSGQSDIQALPTPGTTLMTSIDMRAQPGTAWTDFIIDMDDAGNPCGGGSNTCGVAMVTATDDMGQSFNLTLSNGTNFVTGIAGVNSMGVQEFITDVQVTKVSADPVTGNFGWTDFKQPRVSGLCTVVNAATGSCIAVPISEPRSWVPVMTGLVGMMLVTWRRRRG